MDPRRIKPTRERVERMLSGERARLARLEEEVAKTKKHIEKDGIVEKVRGSYGGIDYRVKERT